MHGYTYVEKILKMQQSGTFLLFRVTEMKFENKLLAVLIIFTFLKQVPGRSPES